MATRLQREYADCGRTRGPSDPVRPVSGFARAAHNNCRRVLVVDDDPYVQKAIARIVGREREVAAVASAAEALDLLEAGERFDAVLCDLCMPFIDGAAFYRAAVRGWPWLAARFVVVTGGALNAEQEIFLRNAPCPVLPKPFELEELLAVVRAAIARADALEQHGGDRCG